MNRFLILLCFAQLTIAQTTARLESVKKDGLHRIFIPSGIRSFSRPDLADLRISDQMGNEVPYKIASPNNDGIHYFKPFHIVSKTAVPKQSTSVVVENPISEINEITLHIANAEVTKKFSISGSDDLKQWFGLVNSRELSEIENARSSSEYKTILFPLSSYRFLRIDIDDKKTLPLNVLEAGNYNLEKQVRKTEIIAPKKIATTQLKDKKLTLLHVDFGTLQSIDRITFGIAAPNYYKRQVRIFKNVSYQYRKRTRTREEVLAIFELDSEAKNPFCSCPIFEKEFFIEIDNRDNPPLTFTDITFSQESLCAVADLKTNQKYTVKTGNAKMAAPDYDLPSSWAKIQDSFPEAKIIGIMHANLAAATIIQKSFWQQSWFMWTCICLGGLAILYFTVSLVRDIK